MLLNDSNFEGWKNPFGVSVKHLVLSSWVVSFLILDSASKSIFRSATSECNGKRYLKGMLVKPSQIKLPSI